MKLIEVCHRRRQEGLTAPRHPQVLRHSFLDMPINMVYSHITYTQAQICWIFEKGCLSRHPGNSLPCPHVYSKDCRSSNDSYMEEVMVILLPSRQIHGCPSQLQSLAHSLPTVPGSSELHFFHQSSYFILNPSLQIQLSVTTYFAWVLPLSGVIDAPSLRVKGSKVRSLWSSLR